MPPTTQSIEKLQKKLDKDPNSLVFSQLAEEHRKEGNLEDALRILNTGLERHPNYWSARVALGRVHHQMGNIPSAREELEKAVQAAPDNLVANRLLGDIYMSLQLPQDALKRYRIVHMLAPKDQDLATVIKRLEAETAEPEPPVSEPEIPMESAQDIQEEAAVPAEEYEPEQESESYAPTIQMQVPDFLDKTETQVASMDPQSVAEATADVTGTESDSSPDIPLQEFQQQVAVAPEEPETLFESEPEAGDTLILKPAMEAAEESGVPETSQTEESSGEPTEADELSNIAGLLLGSEPPPVEDSGFQELEPDAQLEAAEVVPPAPLDRTQPLDDEEEEELSDAHELTSETLAELYLSQGHVDKAVKVYQRLLMEDPDNQEILGRLKDLSPEDSPAMEEEPVYDEKELLLVESQGSAGSRGTSTGDAVSRREQERQRKISTLESWLTTIRRERD